MTFALMLFDYIDRQVIVSLFPHLKAEWNLTDKQLGGLVSIISIVVTVGGIPVALLADRLSRVKSAHKPRPAFTHSCELRIGGNSRASSLSRPADIRQAFNAGWHGMSLSECFGDFVAAHGRWAMSAVP